MSDLDYDALRKVAEAATPGPWRSILARDSLPACLVAGGKAIADFDEDTRDATHAAAFDPPTVLRLLNLAQRAEVAEALHREVVSADHCHGIVVRDGWQDACGKPPVAIIDGRDQEEGGYWPVCAYHANRYGHGKCVPLADIRAALDREEDQ